MRWPWRKPPRQPEAADGQLVSMTSVLTFTLAPGHPMRAASCVTCRRAVGGDLVIISGLVAVGGLACTCGAVSSEMYLAHASHPRPVARDLIPVVAAQLQDGHEHDWNEVR